jgi:serine/threonine-protein kinase
VIDALKRLRDALADRYAVQHELGRGGMATVYLATDVKHDRSVAIKVLHPDLAASLGADRFLREIQVTAKLSHPHILPLYDSGEADGFLYYVMPLVEGESLADRLDREKQLPILEAVRIAREAAEALAHAHSYGLVHRDIKPGNILLSGGHAVVADFGIARAVTEAGGARITQTGMAIGTPAYMSPEQAAGNEGLDGRSDVYSLGCVVYEMLVGQIPFTGPTPQAIMARHTMDVVPPPTIMRDTIPEELEDIIFCAMAKSPADRFATAHEMAVALDAVALDSGTFHRRSTTATRRRRSTMSARAVPEGPESRWRRGVVIPVIAVLVALTGGLAGWHLLGAGGTRTLPTGGPDPQRIAVLYFEDRSQGEGIEHLASGLTEALIHELSQVEQLRVVSRNGVLPFRDSPVSPDSISRALGVGTLVDGSVAQSGELLRVSVALINAATGEELDSRRIERPRTEIFALQDDLARELSLFLRQRLGQEIALRQQRAATGSPAAWELVQRGEVAVRDAERLRDDGDIDGAARLLHDADSLMAEATTLDRRWAAPWTRQGWIAYQRARLAGVFDKGHNDEWTRQGLEHAAAAIALAPGDPDALELRGTLRYWRYLLNLNPGADAAQLFVGAEQDFRAAVASNPLQASALSSLSHLLMNKGETAEAKVMAQRSYEADPYLQNVNTTLWRLFQSSLDLEDRFEATHWCDEGRRRFPDDARFTECQIWLFALNGVPPDVPRAWDLLDHYVELSPPNIQEFRRLRGSMIVAMALVRSGLPDSARAVIERSRGDPEVDPVRELAFFEALARILLGDRSEALDRLSVYLAANPSQRSSFARDRSWWYADIRDDARFRQLVGSDG